MLTVEDWEDYRRTLSRSPRARGGRRAEKMATASGHRPNIKQKDIMELSVVLNEAGREAHLGLGLKKMREESI